MNEFYHELEIGFNWWYVVVLFYVFVFGMIGAFKFHLNSDRIATRMARKYDIILSLLALGAVLHSVVLVIYESLLGIMQFFANRLHDYESPKYVFWLTIIVLIVSSFFYYYLLIGVANITSWTKLGFLIEKYCKMDEKTKQERIKRELHRQLKQICPQQQQKQEQIVLEPHQYQKILEQLDAMEAKIRQSYGLPQKVS